MCLGLLISIFNSGKNKVEAIMCAAINNQVAVNERLICQSCMQWSS